MPQTRADVLREILPTLQSFVERLPEVETQWQPSDFLPNFNGEGWREELDRLRADAAHLSDEVLVVLVGNIVTEEALPSYQTALNRFEGMSDSTGRDETPWARWSRAWTAEEKRHGDLTRAYLYLSGRADMKSVEQTIQHLLRRGFDTGAGGDPYRGLVYASVQEHATKTSWLQLGTLVGKAGAALLHRMSGLVAADEARHERVYCGTMRAVADCDPEGALEAMEGTLARAIAMPAKAMTDGRDRSLFQHFADVGQRIGVYTLRDYARNVEQFIERMGVAEMSALTGESARRQELLCGLAKRYFTYADRYGDLPAKPVRFRWIHDRRA